MDQTQTGEATRRSLFGWMSTEIWPLSLCVFLNLIYETDNRYSSWNREYNASASQYPRLPSLIQKGKIGALTHLRPEEVL